VQTSQDQPVISTGPYRVVRHPGYAGILAAVVGLGFVIDNWVSLVVLTVAIAGGLIYRIGVEERALARDLGGRYQSYAESRKRLVPFVW
jgi:protein-S-isoprenylcysteine O-methyltransferase Ste14